MTITRITSHKDGQLLAEHLYAESRQDKAIERFRREYPEHADCIVVAQSMDADDPKNARYINLWLTLHR